MNIVHWRTVNHRWRYLIYDKLIDSLNLNDNSCGIENLLFFTNLTFLTLNNSYKSFSLNREENGLWEKIFIR